LQAVWNGHCATVAMLLRADTDPSLMTLPCIRNELLRTAGGESMTELDLALMRRFLDTAQLLGESVIATASWLSRAPTCGCALVLQ
jgi:hypothetical protein